MLFWAIAIGVYLLMTGLIVWRAVHDSAAPELVQPDIWILMGGAAIATLAGDHIHKAGLRERSPGDGRDVDCCDGVDPAADLRHAATLPQATRASAGAVVGGGVPTRDVLVGHVCHGRRNRLAVADDGVAGVLLDRVRGVGHRGDRIAAAISAITRCGYSVRSSHVNRNTCQPSSAMAFWRLRSFGKSSWVAVERPAVDLDRDLLLGNATSTLYPPIG